MNVFLESFMKIDILRTHFFRILTSSKGAEDGFPELITKLLEKPPGQRCPGGFSLGGTYKECKMQFLYVELTIFVI